MLCETKAAVSDMLFLIRLSGQWDCGKLLWLREHYRFTDLNIVLFIRTVPNKDVCFDHFLLSDA